MDVLVTGGAGFLGAHLARRLRTLGRDVVALDDLSTGRADRVPAGVRLLVGDVRDHALVEGLVASSDLVFHLAAAVGPALVARDPAGTWSRNVEGTAAVLEAAARRGTRVVLASSSEVYGMGREGPLGEEDDLVLRSDGRRDVYALSKAAGESLAFALARSSLLPFTVVRLFNVVGPGQSGRYGMVLPRFVAAAREGRPLPVYGDGRQRRCFLHVDDAVEALVRLAGTPEAEGLVVNVGSPDEVTILDLARLVLGLSGSTAGVTHVPIESVYGEGYADPRRRVPDVRRLEALLGPVPRRDLSDAVRALLEEPAAQAVAASSPPGGAPEGGAASG
jgi:UDP-glucose 4-epimerase